MIFCSKNEEGIPAWQLVIEDKKTVTRRLKPEKVGAIRAVCPNRGKKQVCKIKIVSCVPHNDWEKKIPIVASNSLQEAWEKEAKLEGFNTADGLLTWFIVKGINIHDTFRIEFERVKP